ncbi:hypothetical protein OAO38_04265 [Candidatus Pelagibacter ubique]|nr:hypothetical protein [Candidatus Pelagibacter ubique]
MLKSIAKLLLASLLSLIFITSNTLAFHKENGLTKTVETKWNGDPKNAKTFEDKAKIKYCSLKSKAIELIEKDGGEPVIDLITGKQRIDEDTGKKVFDDKKSYKIKITSYHSSKLRKTGKVLIPTPTNGLNFNINNDWLNIKLIDVLRMYCLQDSTMDRPTKFKDLGEFYKEVAADNGYLKQDGVTGDYNKKLMEGPNGRGPKADHDILKDGIIINNPNAVWYVPDFLIQKDIEITKVNKQEAIEKSNREKKEAKRRAVEEGNESWLSKYQQNYIDEFNKKIYEYDAFIKELSTKRDKLETKVSNFEELISKANKESSIAIEDLVNRGNEQVNRLKGTIRSNKTLYLSDSDLENYESRLKEIKIESKKYANYKKLKRIINKASKSKKATDFVGKDGFKIQLPEFLGGKIINMSTDEIGFIQDFKNLKELGSGSKEDLEKINNLNKDIDQHISDINEFILEPVKNLIILDNAIQNKTPWPKYLTYIAIFFAIIGVIIYVFIQQRNMRILREESEEKVGSLKNEFEGKLRNTSEQIRSSVSRSTVRTQQTGTMRDPEPVQKIQKTLEEIIADKYKEIESDYKEALEDFSKVSLFKEKWNGLALSRKERQDGTKTILIHSTRIFEKAGIWCVNFDDKYYAFPGSTVKSNMATYMNMDFMKAGQDFKGVFNISTGASYIAESSELRKGGAGFVVEKIGKIIFPD